MTLSIQAIKQVKPGEILWDRGLGVRGNADGSSTYLASYYDAEGKKRRKVLGFTDRMKLSEVQRIVGERIGAWKRGEDTGVDAGDTMESLADAYMTQYSEALNAPSTVKLNRHLLGLYILPALGEQAIASVTKRQVSDLVSSVAERSHYQANKVRGLLVALFGFAHARGYLAEATPSPMDGFKAAGRSANYPVQSRKRVATDAELRALLATLEAQGPPWRGFFLMLLHTGARPGELVKLTWADVYDGWATFRETKNHTDRRVPLHPVLLRELGAEQGTVGRSGRVFWGCDHYQRPWLAWCKASGVSALRVYDLRHTVATGCEAISLDRPATQRLLGHKDATMTGHYVEVPDERLKRAVWAWVERLQTV